MSKVLITGATGFLGRYIVSELVANGHQVRAVIRPGSDRSAAGWLQDLSVEATRLDLRARRTFGAGLHGVDVVVHAAAAKGGDLYAQMGSTVVATENLLAAMLAAGIRRIVHISSFAVYAFHRIQSLSCLDEQSLTEIGGFDRDEYAQAKLIQERLVVDCAKANGWDATILRPGAIYGPQNTWTARIGLQGRRNWVVISPFGHLPLCYVENCAQAIGLAVSRALPGVQVLNLTDDQPRTIRYVRELRRRGQLARPIPVPWLLWRGLAGMASLVNRLLLSGSAKLPGVLVRARADARFKPLRYSNAMARELLGWAPRFALSEALDRCFEESRAVATPS